MGRLEEQQLRNGMEIADMYRELGRSPVLYHERIADEAGVDVYRKREFRQFIWEYSAKRHMHQHELRVIENPYGASAQESV